MSSGPHTPTRRERPAAPDVHPRQAEEGLAEEKIAEELIPDLDGSSLINVRRSRRDQLTRRLLALGDASSLVFAIGLAVVVADQRLDPWPMIGLVALTLPAWILLFKIYKLYDRYTTRISHTGVDDIPWLVHSLLVGALAFWGLTKVVDVGQLTFREGAIFGIVALITILAMRSVMSRLARRTFGNESLLMAGSGPNMHTLLGKINQHPEYGLTPIAMLDGLHASPREEGEPEMTGGLRSFGAAVKFERLCQEIRPERVIIDRVEFRAEGVIAMIDTCRRLSIKVSILPDAVESLGPSVEVDAVQGVTLLGVNPPMLGATSRGIKRAFDLFIAASVLLISAPVMLLMAIAIRLDTRGPVLFKQARVGRGGKQFLLFKFRTMSTDAEARQDELMKQSRDPNWLDLAEDPRVTGVGRFLRRTSLDELPQLINVLRGEMSLVGPRPLPEAEDAMVNGYARGRLDLTPGVTGLWQVLGRTVIPFDEMVKLDYVYVTNWSLWLDLRLLLQTLPAVLGRRGAN